MPTGKRASSAKAMEGTASVRADGETNKRFTRDEVALFLAEIAKNVVQSHTTALHSMLALNEILRLPYAAEVLDKDLRDQARDLWLKIKGSGLHLVDPPILFGDQVAIPAEYDIGNETAVDGHDPADQVSGRTVQ